MYLPYRQSDGVSQDAAEVIDRPAMLIARQLCRKMTGMRRSPLVFAVLFAALVLAGCAPGGETVAAGGSSSTGRPGSPAGAAGSLPTTSAGASSTSGAGGDWGAMAGCPSVGRALPAGVRSGLTIDVDGDGRPDTEWIGTSPDAGGGIPFGVRTASGAVLSSAISSASPIARSVMFADLTGHGDVVALASDGRQVLLYAVIGCQVNPEENGEGQQYAFDLGLTGLGTGVGCADVTGNGPRDLLGLKLITDTSGAPTAIERTTVVLNGTQARNGAISTVPAPDTEHAQQALSITCGDLSMTNNGVSSGP